MGRSGDGVAGLQPQHAKSQSGAGCVCRHAFGRRTSLRRTSRRTHVLVRGVGDLVLRTDVPRCRNGTSLHRAVGVGRRGLLVCVGGLPAVGLERVATRRAGRACGCVNIRRLLFSLLRYSREGWGGGCVEGASVANSPHPNPPPEYRRRGKDSSPKLSRSRIEHRGENAACPQSRYNNGILIQFISALSRKQAMRPLKCLTVGAISLVLFTVRCWGDDAPKPLYLDPSQSAEARAKDLVSRLTLE